MDSPRLCFLPGAALPLSTVSSVRHSSFTAPLHQHHHHHRLSVPRHHNITRKQHRNRNNSQTSITTTTTTTEHAPAVTCSSASDDAARRVDARVARDVGSGPGVMLGAVPPLLRNVLSAAVVGLSAAGAYKATPDNIGPTTIVRPAAAVVSATAVAGVGVVALRSGPHKAARKFLAGALAGHGVASSQLIDGARNLQGKFGLSVDDALQLKMDLYQAYLIALVEKAQVAFSEMSDLARLKHSLELSGAAIGNVHYEACREFYRGSVVMLDATDDEVGRKEAQARLDKLVFLSDRMYADKDTEEAYLYEKSRLVKFFRMSDDEYVDRVARVSLPFFSDVVARAVKDAAVSKDDLIAAQATLGVRDVDAERIRADAYTKRVERLISEKGKVDDTDKADLSRLCAVLDVEEDRAVSALRTLGEPVFRAEVVKALDAVANKSESPASIYGRLALRQTELAMPGDAARDALAVEITERAVGIVKLGSKYLRVQNVNGCIKQVEELLSYVDGVVTLMRVSADHLKDDDTLIIQTFLGSVSENLAAVEPRQMYRLYLSKCLEDRRISEEEDKQLTRLRAVLSLSERTALEAFNLAAGPVYRKAVADAVKDNIFSEEEKGQIQQLREDLSLPKNTWKKIELDIYAERIHRLVDGNRIIQETEAQELFSFRDFLGLTMEDTAPIHKVTMGPVYEQSVTEAMGPTGIMLDEYRNGLERLRERLGLTKEDADAAFFKVVKQRMLVYVNRAMSQLEKRQQFRGQNEERDVGDDPNIKRAGAFLGIDAGGLPIELSNLVDFYVRNGIMREEEVPVEGSGDDGSTDGEKQTKKVQRYPITLKQDISPKVYNELYKQYVIQCFSAQTRGEKQRLFSVLDQLGCILGLDEDEIGKIHSEIGTVIYKNYVSQALVKGPLEDKDREFLTNIERMLSMKSDQCERLLKEGKETRISVMLEQIFAQPKVLAETIRKMRDMAAALDVDIVRDLKVPADQRGKLFNVEVDTAIDTGALTADNQALIKELQDSLQIDDEAAKEIVLECIQKRTLSHLVQATASLRQQRSEMAVAELKTMLRYGKLLPAKVPAPAVSTQEKQELYLLFQADVITDGVVDQASREQIELLKTLFGFTDADLEVVV